MDNAFLSFLLNSPETSIPYPWERVLNLRTEILFYKNRLDGSVVVDMRSRVNLGGGLYHFNTIWEELTGCCFYNPHCPLFPRSSVGAPFLIHAACCGPSLYFLVPELVICCPICGSPILLVI